MSGVWDSDDWRDYLEIDDAELYFPDGMPPENGVRMVEEALCAFLERAVLPLLAPGAAHDQALAYARVKAAHIDLEQKTLPFSVKDEALAPVFWDTLREAEDLLRAGLAEDAAHRLHLLTRPKFKRLPTCDAAYAEAMGGAYGPFRPGWADLLLFEGVTP